MESARWWLLMLAAVMFSMSGCTAGGQPSQSAQSPAHLASVGH
jgi:hypothetical protein